MDPPQINPLLPLSDHRSDDLPAEAQGLTWEDTFFVSEELDDREHLLVAVFDIDYDALERGSRIGLVFWFATTLLLLLLL